VFRCVSSVISVLFSKLVYTNKLLEQQATRDALTNIFSRNRFNDMLRIETMRTLRYTTPLSLILFDVDDSKRVNDRYGHTIGDDVLRDLRAIIKHHVRDRDYFDRWGGEEFALLVTNTASDSARIPAEKPRVAIQNAPVLATGSATCGFGVVQFQDGDTMDSPIKKADDGLSRAKSRGRNRVE
jgi:diguanylate cyclase (GGDEF)-like protein